MTDPVQPARTAYPPMGERLRSARQARNLTLRELAQRLGVSPSMISQIETGRASPSVSTLYAMANELDVSLDELLFNDRRPAGPHDERASAPPVDALLQRADNRKRIRLASGVVWERLTPLSEPDTEFLYVTYEVGGASSADSEFQRHGGHEWGFVLEGRLEVRIGFQEYVLEPGDSISFDSTTPHRLANVGQTPVHAIWFVLGRIPGGVSAADDLHASTPAWRSRRRPAGGRT
ncbi:MAG TPA: XRE family transcriptional regulator [Candidatus Limnocylindria bacterium]|nr:XRE family transcriptional regulator [Candidatus Limnocylindria bacterium]